AGEVQQQFPQHQPLSIAEILHWPGVLKSQGVNQEALTEEVRAGLSQVLQDMSDSRMREGAKLKAMILERLVAMEQVITSIKPLLPLQIKAYQERLATKLQETL